MATKLKNVDRLYLVTEDEFKKLSGTATSQPSPSIGPVLNPNLKVAKDDAKRLMRVAESDEHPALKAARYERLVDKYFNDLSRLPPNRPRQIAPSEDPFEARARAIPERDARPKLAQFTPAAGSRSRIPVSERKRSAKRFLPRVPTFESDDDDDEAIEAEESPRRASRARRRDELIRASKTLPSKGLRSRVVSPIARPTVKWQALGKKARR